MWDRERLRKHPLFNPSAQLIRRGTGLSVPRSTPSRLGRLAVTAARRARSTAAARCFTTFSSSNARLFTREFVRGSFLVRGASALGGDCSLCLRIHRRESAWRLSTHAASAPRIRSAVASTAAASPSYLYFSSPLWCRFDFRSSRCFLRPLHCFRFARPFVPLGCWAGPPLSISLPRYSLSRDIRCRMMIAAAGHP